MNPVRQYRPDDDEPEQVRPRRRSATGFRCPYCRTREMPIRKSKVTPAGIVLFWILLCSIIGTFFCWAGLLLREEYRTCSQCGMKLG